PNVTRQREVLRGHRVKLFEDAPEVSRAKARHVRAVRTEACLPIARARRGKGPRRPRRREEARGHRSAQRRRWMTRWHEERGTGVPAPAEPIPPPLDRSPRPAREVARAREGEPVPPISRSIAKTVEPELTGVTPGQHARPRRDGD